MDIIETKDTSILFVNATAEVSFREMARGLPILIVFVLATTHFTVARKRQNNCGVDSHCLPWKTFSTRNFINDKRHESSEGIIRKNHTKQRPGEETGSKRDNTFTDALKNLLARVDNARRKVMGLNSPPQAKVETSPTIKPVGIPMNASKTTPAPNSSGLPAVTTAPSASPTSGGTSAATPGSEGTSPPAGTPTHSPSPTPTTAVTASPNASCNASSGACPSVKPTLKPGKHNITIAPGVILTPNGEIILGPQLPLLVGGGQTSGGQTYPGVKPGAGQPPGTVSIPSGMVTSGHHGAPAQPGRPSIQCQIFFNLYSCKCSLRNSG